MGSVDRRSSSLDDASKPLTVAKLAVTRMRACTPGGIGGVAGVCVPQVSYSEGGFGSGSFIKSNNTESPLVLQVRAVGVDGVMALVTSEGGKTTGLEDACRRRTDPDTCIERVGPIAGRCTVRCVNQEHSQSQSLLVSKELRSPQVSHQASTWGAIGKSSCPLSSRVESVSSLSGLALCVDFGPTGT